jgi:hypothetical protein
MTFKESLKELSMKRLAFAAVLLAAQCGGRPLGQPKVTRPVDVVCSATGPGDQCTQDSQCSGKLVCLCENQIGFGNGNAPHGNRCAASGDCRVDADCPGGGCSPTVSFDCGTFYGVVGYFCHTPNDACTNDSDCTAQPGGYCAFEPAASHWSCGYSHCAG